MVPTAVVCVRRRCLLRRTAEDGRRPLRHAVEADPCPILRGLRDPYDQRRGPIPPPAISAPGAYSTAASVSPFGDTVARAGRCLHYLSGPSSTTGALLRSGEPRRSSQDARPGGHTRRPVQDVRSAGTGMVLSGNRRRRVRSTAKLCPPPTPTRASQIADDHHGRRDPQPRAGPTLLERDFNFPPFDELLGELGTVRGHLAAARSEARNAA